MGQQVRDIEAAMSGFKTGSLSQLFLPRMLRAETPGRGAHPSKDGGASGTDGAKQKVSSKDEGGTKEKLESPDWWSKNPNPVTEWRIPDGKAYADFFDFKSETLKSNTLGWPRIKSHHPRMKGGKTFLCLKYQCIGSCVAKCGNSHVDP
jgi:hypothetical protein